MKAHTCRSTLTRTGILLVLLATVAGCRSAPTRYFSLAPQAPVANTNVASAVKQQPVALIRTTIPDTAERMQLVVRESATRVQIRDTDRWVTPLQEQIPAILVENLRANLHNRIVVNDKRMAGPEPAMTLVVDIERFDAVAGGEAVVAARWLITRGPDRSPVTGSGISTKSVTGRSSDALVLAWSQGLADISVAIADSVNAASAEASNGS